MIGSTLLIKTVTANDFRRDAEIDIINATYGDFDNDLKEDDIVVVAKFKADVTCEVQCQLILDLRLPSGKTFRFTFIVSFYSIEDMDTIITFTTFNTALESGWYIAIVSGYFLIDGYCYYLTDSIVFDPPTEEEEGDPGAVITISN
jgi:hypothetical protein